jgi:hypothetical protein
MCSRFAILNEGGSESRQMKALGSVAAMVLVLSMTVAQSAGSARTGEQTPRAAVWSPHALIVDLPNLPKHYTCDELWYKFRDVLLAIGARPDLSILPYQCEGRSNSLNYSPRVQLEFSIPREVTGNDRRWAELQVMAKSIRLEPGTPGHLDGGDCALLDQMRSTLLRSIGDSVTDVQLPCQAPQASGPPFALTVKALVPVTQSPSDLARVPSAARRGVAGSGGKQR